MILDSAISHKLKQHQRMASLSNETYVNNTIFSNVSDVSIEKTATCCNLYLCYKYWYFGVDIILILPTIFGNSLILIALIRFKNLRKTKPFILVGNLAISDLLIGLVLFPMDLVVLNKPALWETTEVCVWYLCIIYTVLTASVLNLFILSVERFHAITKPFQHRTAFTAKRIYYAACISWLFVLPSGFTPLILFSSGHHLYDLNSFETCGDVLLIDSPYILFMSCFSIVALLISSVFFVIVLRIALRKCPQSLEVGDRSGNRDNSRHNSRRDIQHTRLMAFVSGTFIICWAPYCISTLIHVPYVATEPLSIHYWLASLGLINCCLNWIIYGATNKRFRAAFISILNCSCRKRNIQR